jgi:streptomycin 6-kinase
MGRSTSPVEREWNVPDVTIPSMLAEYSARERTGRQRAWIDALPQRVAGLAERWSLVVDEPYEPGGVTAWVAPARQGNTDLVLKVAWRHYEAEHEADGLREWNGNGTARLHDSFAYDDETIGLLLERCVPGTNLESCGPREQDEVVAGVLRRLWIEPVKPNRFRPLQKMCDYWADEFERKRADTGGSLDDGLVRVGLEMFRTLPATADRCVLLGTDVHAQNILAAEREPWLAIDPKPYVGDPTYDPVQYMLNGVARFGRDPHALIARMADLCELDAERLGQWMFARCVEESPEWPELNDAARQLAP